MEKNRGGEHDRVRSIENAAMTLNHVPPVLHAPVALDGRHHEAAAESHHRDDCRKSRRLERREGCHPPEGGSEQRSAADSSDEPLPRFRWREARRHLVTSKKLAPYVLEHVARLNHQYQ